MTFAAAMVLRNEGHRIEALVARLRPYVGQIVIGVQDSEDNTLELARKLGDQIVTDVASGFGDSTFGPKVLPLVEARWVLKVDGDEMPTEALLASLPDAIAMARRSYFNAVWLRFRSWIEDEEWPVRHGHVRLFETSLGWPSTMHSRPKTEAILEWDVPDGWIEHRKSLDEHVRGYLGYLAASGTNAGWNEHNRAMIFHAVTGAAATKGWDWIKAHDWWPEVEPIFAGPSSPPVP